MVTVFSRYQHDEARLSSAFRRASRLIVRSSLPLSIIIAIEIPRITLLLLDETWLPIVPVLRALLLFTVCRPLIEAVFALLRSIGDARGIVGFTAFQVLVLAVLAPTLTFQMGDRGDGQ